MTTQDKNLLIRIIIGLLVFVASFFAIELLGQFLSYFLIKAAVAAVITWAVVISGASLGLPGFGKKTNKKK